MSDYAWANPTYALYIANKPDQNDSRELLLTHSREWFDIVGQRVHRHLHPRLD